MKAIETEYNGYRFRSRLEARWAVFFDKLRIKYEYEPEGIVLSDGTYYLPDFYLPEFCCYFEVKRNGIQDTPEGLEAIRKISDGMNTNEWAGIIAFGDPMDDQLYIFCQETDDEGGGSYKGRITIGLHPYYYVPCLLVAGDSRVRHYYDSFGEEMKRIPLYTAGKRSPYEAYVNSAVHAMRKMARQARFEHGQTLDVGWEGYR